MAYCTAAYTGLRASELASLQPKAFSLETEPATVTVEAGSPSIAAKTLSRSILTSLTD